MRVFRVTNDKIESGISISTNPYPKFSFRNRNFDIDQPDAPNFIEYKDQKAMIQRAGLKIVAQQDLPEPPVWQFWKWIAWKFRNTQPQRFVLFPDDNEEENEKALIFWDVYTGSTGNPQPELLNADFITIEESPSAVGSVSPTLYIILILSPDMEVSIQRFTLYTEDGKEQGLYMVWNGTDLVVETRITDMDSFKWKTVKIFE